MVPAARPVTIPPTLTDATPVALLLQAPPVLVEERVVDAPAQTEVAPEIVPATGLGETVKE